MTKVEVTCNSAVNEQAHKILVLITFFYKCAASGAGCLTTTQLPG